MNVAEFIEKNGGEFYNIDGSEPERDSINRTVLVEIMISPWLMEKLKIICDSDDIEDVAEMISETINMLVS